MKGIMVSLLIFLTTGIVVGQQSDSSNNSFKFGPKSSNNLNDLHKPLEIAVPADIRSKLMQGKVLKAPVEARDPSSNQLLDSSVINGVSFFPKGKNPSQLHSIAVEGRTNGDGTLRFGLTDQHLTALENGQLKYDFGSQERGKYDKIEVFYAGQPARGTSDQNKSNGFKPIRSPGPDDQSSQGDLRPFRPVNQKRAQQFSSIPLPAPADADPWEDHFMGPFKPASATPPANKWSPPNKTAQNADRFNPNFKPPKTESPWLIPNTDRAAELAWKKEQAELEQKRKDEEYARKLQDYKYQQYLANQEEERKAQAARDTETKRLAALAEYEKEMKLIAWRKQQASKTTLSPIGTPPYGNQPTLAGPQVNPKTGLTWIEQRELELYQKEQLLNSKESSLTLQSKLLADQKARIEGDLIRQKQLRTFRPQDETPNWHQSPNIETGREFYPTNDGTILARTPERFASNDYSKTPIGSINEEYQQPNSRDINPGSGMLGNIKDYAAQLPGPNNGKLSGNLGTNSSNEQTRDGRINGFVMFLLFCSLGLNIYLMFISRGFYVRYNELADELRETFSATL